MRPTFEVIYRVGGSDRFEWKRTAPVSRLSQGQDARDEIVRGGRLAYLYRSDLLEAALSIGSFSTFEPVFPYFDESI